jgi:hypothetical protein
MGIKKRIAIAQATGKPLPADAPTEETGPRYARVPDGPEAKKKKRVDRKPFTLNWLDIIIHGAVNQYAQRTRKPVVERHPEPTDRR